MYKSVKCTKNLKKCTKIKTNCTLLCTKKYLMAALFSDSLILILLKKRFYGILNLKNLSKHLTKHPNKTKPIEQKNQNKTWTNKNKIKWNKKK